MRVLVWNLFHGRADPPAGRPLLHEFATAIDGWAWDVALLQEVPPWWPAPLARATGAAWRAAPTSRNACLPVRRAIAARRPDLLKSNGGGANAILVRGPLAITAHARRRLRLRPERRVVHAVRLRDAAGRPRWVGNVHAQLGGWEDAAAMHRPRTDAVAALAALERWSGGAPALLGGDLNLPAAAVRDLLPDGWSWLGGHGPDHVVARGPRRVAATSPDAGTLSDHRPLLLTTDG
ncbi:hypothetical protein SK069_11775 [Patulibacter brassicae]|uniref:Endonuclease/exonuclease/phosphatase domain-containing protein n=1 Tax=Patulibacter brassicae TaxID=1705717 RepID=A0ABU4VKC3_9ACTN|nr:endonuclease/exonuclease/phosphatase family protein [Patulibacter brassicae]MDX8152278.1 hypothetical protein [Patulibacter brassicae]